MNLFNYISIGDLEYNKNVEKEFTIPRSRMLEYTPTDLEKRLETLDGVAINFLSELNTFLCSEIEYNGENFSIIVDYGTISEIKIDKFRVFAKFISSINLGELKFDTEEEVRSIFELDRFQLGRTHWSVRKGSAKSILKELLQKNHNIKYKVKELNNNNPTPPPRNKNIIGTAHNTEEFLGILQKIKTESDAENFFRGHSDSNYELTPSLLRKWSNGDWQFMPNEERLCKELLIAHYDEFQTDQYCFDRLVRMQHYGLPTRLLDISSNPLVALFFACTCASEKMETEGEVIIFQIKSEYIKYYDSDTASCISNISNLTYKQKDEFDFSKNQTDFNNSDVTKKLLHYIRSEKPFFESKILPNHINSIICVKAKQTNARIKSQSGAFLLFGHDVKLPDHGQDGIYISRITIKNKSAILSQLDRININATTVYPSIDQTATHLKGKYQIQEKTP